MTTGEVYRADAEVVGKTTTGGRTETKAMQSNAVSEQTRAQEAAGYNYSPTDDFTQKQDCYR